MLPVLGTAPGWVRVRLAQRPNGSTAWLPARDVKLSSTPYVIVIDLATTRLSLYDHGRRVFSAPAGVGTPNDPTPPGGYFVAFTEGPPQPNLGYGPFIIVTSAHSPNITDWEGSGDAVIGIHGPLGEDSQIGTTGARISHGCIRLHDAALKKLSSLPAGTPIYISVTDRFQVRPRSDLSLARSRPSQALRPAEPSGVMATIRLPSTRRVQPRRASSAASAAPRPPARWCRRSVQSMQGRSSGLVRCGTAATSMPRSPNTAAPSGPSTHAPSVSPIACRAASASVTATPTTPARWS